MKSINRSEPPIHRISEKLLQQTFEAMLEEINRIKLDAAEKKELIAMLQNYRSAWNGYVRMIKSRQGREVD